MPEIVQVVQGQKQKGGEVARRRGRGAADGGRAEFRWLFVSLVDPAGLLDMERCGEIAVRMGEAASGSGYRAGARMASLLADIFADMSDIVYRPVEDGALHQTMIASRKMKVLLYDTAVSYREGGDDEPVGGLEELRRDVAVLRSEADANRAKLRAADPPGVRLARFDSLYKGMICRDVIRVDIEGVRARRKAEGVDPVFPPEPEPIEMPDAPDGLDLSPADWVAIARGYGPLEGYDLDGAEDGK